MPWRVARVAERCPFSLCSDPGVAVGLWAGPAACGFSPRKALVRSDVAVIGPVARIGVASRPFASIIETTR